jgi:hypothetical protein
MTNNSVSPILSTDQKAEAEKLRDMILTKEGENNILKEKITSLQEDIDTVCHPLLPKSRGDTILIFVH